VIKLYNAGTNALLGEITDAQLAFLQEQFEEEWSGDQDYYLNRARSTCWRGREQTRSC
jgi:hypothetical protein